MHAVIFDMDGVLVDSRPLYCRVIAETLRERGIALSLDEIAGKVVPHVKKWVDSVLPQNLEDRERSLDDLTLEVRDRMATVPATLATAAGAEKVLSELGRRYPLFLITNSGAGFAERVLSQAKLSRFFEKVVTANDGFPGKEAAITAVVGERGISPREAVYIGDTEHDVVYGKKAGCRVIVVYSPFSWVYGGLKKIEEAGPDLIVNSLKALPEILAGPKW